MAEFRMPSLGADMTEGTLVEWLVSVGDQVERGDIVAVVDTDKSAIEVEVFETGTVEELLVEPGATVPVGTPLARIGDGSGASDGTRPGTAEPAASEPEPRVAEPEPEPTVAEPEPEPAAAEPPVAGGAPPPRATTTSPLVRHRADELGVDVALLAGTGPGGSVSRADVEAAAHTTAVPPTPAGHGGPHGVAASPLARRLAELGGLDLAAIAGSGPDGAVVAADVRLALSAAPGVHVPGAVETDTPSVATGTQPTGSRPTGTQPTGAPARPVTTDRRASLRRAVGELMARSAREVPHYHLRADIDLAPAFAWLSERNADRPVTERVLPAALLLRATVLACADAPDLNGHWVDGDVVRSDAVHLGVAVSLRGGGLVAPAIRDADQLDLDGLMARLRDLVTRTRAGNLRASELSDPTITVTNLGDTGVDVVHGVIFPPQVGLVGFGRIADRPWARDGMLGVHPVVAATLAADHRATDGRDGARLLAAIDHHLQHPEAL